MKEHQRLLENQPPGSSDRPRGVLAQKHWRLVLDASSGISRDETRQQLSSFGGARKLENERSELNALMDLFADAECNEPNPLLSLLNWASLERGKETLALGSWL